MIMDINKQGARARTVGRPRYACPYPADSRERRAWFEGFDGSAWDCGTRTPRPTGALAATASTGGGMAGLDGSRTLPQL
ncbi:ribosome modulation factor [Methylobacterium mesophilicum]|uniref:ribosome modulation factor n=1 Tax=Methylobacterium mesophilicum TaxID=39956 RepID=UPI002F35F52A